MNYNILMYSHDTYGLGHIRRTMAIASHLRDPDTNILILTGSPIAGRFSFPMGVDFVRIPGMIKKTNDEYLPLSIRLDARHAMEIRQNIITATARTFQPDLFIVDKEPLGLRREVLPTLEWLRRHSPGTRTILGLRDIMDDGATVRSDWREKGIYEILDTLYSEIWVYGLQEYYDPVVEYDIPAGVVPKIQFIGYIPREVVGPEKRQRMRRECGCQPEDKLVVVTPGGGGDGFELLDAFVGMMEQEPRPHDFHSVIITGPFMPSRERKGLVKRASRIGVRIFRFHPRMEEVLAAADLVVSMGGYNTFCEVMSQKIPNLVVPRETPRSEQLIRARIFKDRGLLDYIPYTGISPQALKVKITELLSHPDPYLQAIERFPLTGTDCMAKRLNDFRTSGR